jgi:hypothetical protein
VTRVRRMATGAFATMGAEMVIAAIVNVRICGTKSGRQIDGSAAFRPRNPRLAVKRRFPKREVLARRPRRRVFSVLYGDSVSGM